MLRKGHVASHNKQGRLLRASCGLALLEEIPGMNQTAGTMGPHGPGPDQYRVRPGQSFL
jgi:hypothetical protein